VKPFRRPIALLAAACVFAALLVCARAGAGDGTFVGTLDDGAGYEIVVPVSWNGTLLLFSHGYRARGSKVDLSAVFDSRWGKWFAAHGYAMAASTYGRQGWAVEEALRDQMALLDLVPRRAGRAPLRTIAFGTSMGGLISAALVQLHPGRFAGAVPMCGVVSGSTALFDQNADAFVALHVLLQFPMPSAGLPDFEQLDRDYGARFATAQSTPQGRARLALIAALAQIPGWSKTDPAAAPPARPRAFVDNQIASLGVVAFLTGIAEEVDERAGGTASSTQGVDYARALANWPHLAAVEAAYRDAGLSLDADLARLNAAPPLVAVPQGARYVARYIDLTGNVGVPVLSMHTIGDDVSPVTTENRYRELVTRSGGAALLRQLYVGRYGHCTFTPAEIVVAVRSLAKRIESGTWGDLSPAALNAAAIALGPSMNQTLMVDDRPEAGTEPHFASYDPPPMER
jgi:pimeloyl-ACP methyl ester carboxylesterase